MIDVHRINKHTVPMLNLVPSTLEQCEHHPRIKELGPRQALLRPTRVQREPLGTACRPRQEIMNV